METEKPFTIRVLLVMLGLINRASIVKPLSRLLSTSSRRLITKGVVSPVNTYPPEMIVPSYVRTGKDEPTQTEISVLNDYVGIFPFIEF